MAKVTEQRLPLWCPWDPGLPFAGHKHSAACAVQELLSSSAPKSRGCLSPVLIPPQSLTSGAHTTRKQFVSMVSGQSPEITSSKINSFNTHMLYFSACDCEGRVGINKHRVRGIKL